MLKLDDVKCIIDVFEECEMCVLAYDDGYLMLFTHEENTGYTFPPLQLAKLNTYIELS